MAQILLVMGIFSVAIVGMAFSLHFSKYKKRPSACCGGANCDSYKQKVKSCYNEKLNYLQELGKE
jgi:hypothetical protein